ncbi:type III endosome membrane protein TEMP-like [Arapaima gigas]
MVFFHEVKRSPAILNSGASSSSNSKKTAPLCYQLNCKYSIMGHIKSSLLTFLCFWGIVTGNDILKVGPCDVSIKEVSFNCSQRGLKQIPTEIWDNVTILDLSENQLNLTNPEHHEALHRFQQVLLLNLSGNYLPLLEKDTLGSFPSLQVLDLSTCQLTDIKPNALQGLGKLRTLLLRSNKLHDLLPTFLQNLKELSLLDLHNNPYLRSAPEDWLKRIQNYHSVLASYHIYCSSATQDKSPEAEHTPSWLYLVAALGTVLAISLFIFLLVKCKLFQHYLDSYRHALLSEADTTSQCDRASLGVGFSDRSMENRAPNLDDHNEMDDDDGFIEDNYIQASERERAEKEEAEKEHDLEYDDQFSFD